MRQIRNRIRFIPTRPTDGKTHLNSGQLVWVQCTQHRCLAYQNKAGAWTSFYTGKTLTDFVSVIG